MPDRIRARVSRVVSARRPSATPLVTPQQAKQIMDFVRTVPSIHHHIESIDALNWPEVTVETGPHGKRHGDFLRLRLDKAERWHILEKSKWDRNEPVRKIGLTRLDEKAARA